MNVLKNFNRNTEDLKILFFTLAKAYTKQQFETITERIDQIDTRIDYTCLILVITNGQELTRIVSAHGP